MSEPEAMKVRWDPDQYRRFASHRLRPALDLAARLEGLEPRTIYDLGCGTGEITRILAQRWPAARVRGIDSSEAMLDKARAAATDDREGLTFELGDLASWTPAEPADLLFSNAAYHWIPNHRAVFPHLLDALAPGGAIAVQMPMSWDLPSHRAMREVLELGRSGGTPPSVVSTTLSGADVGAEDRGFGSRALREAMGRKPLLDTAEYYDLLRAACHRSRHLGDRVPAVARRRGRGARVGERHRAAAHPRGVGGRGARCVPRALSRTAARALPAARRRAHALPVPALVPLRAHVT